MFARSIGRVVRRSSSRMRRGFVTSSSLKPCFSRRFGGFAGGAFLGATFLGASTIFAQENESNKFDIWAKEIEGRNDLIEEVDVYTRVEKQGTGKGNCDTTARSLIWHTLQGHGKIERFRMWKLESDEAQRQVKSSDMVRPGKARTYSLVRLGDHVCGHKEFIHGGMTAALIDDLFGWMTGIERTYLIAENAKMYKNAKAFTAKLTINYRRPLPKKDVFLVECKVARVEKQKKVWLETKIYDHKGNVLVDGEALYIITGLNRGN